MGEELIDLKVDWEIADWPGVCQILKKEAALVEILKSGMRAKAKHSFRWIKGIFVYDKMHYLGLVKNMASLFLLA